MVQIFRKTIVLLVFLWCNLALAASPVIQSVTTDDNTIEIWGTEFGTKSPAEPILWDNFENGQNGSLLTLIQTG